MHVLTSLDLVIMQVEQGETRNWTDINSNSEFLIVITSLLTPWSRVLLEKLTGSAASQEIPRIFGTRKFITVLTSARHLFLS